MDRKAVLTTELEAIAERTQEPPDVREARVALVLREARSRQVAPAAG